MPFFLPFYNRIYSSRPLIEALRSLGVEGESSCTIRPSIPGGVTSISAIRRSARPIPGRLKRPEGNPLPRVVVTRDSRATELGTPLREDYRKEETVRVRRKNYDVFVRK
jgi:hypothetical protein